MFCTKCGTKLSEDSKFCTNCGAVINTIQQPEPTVQTETTAQPEPVVQTEATAQPEPVAQTEVTAQPEPVAQTEVTPQPEPVAQPEATAQPEPAVQPEPTPQPISQPGFIQPQQPVYQQPVQPQPMYQQPQQPTNDKKSSNVILIVIIVILFIVAGVVLGIYFMKDNKSNNSENNTNENEFENETPNKTTTTTTTEKTTKRNDTSSTKGSIDFSGFTFKKLSGFQYSVDDDQLNIVNDDDDLYIVIEAGEMTFDECVKNKDEIKARIESTGIELSNYKNSTYKGVKMITFEATYQNQSIIYFIAETDADDIIFAGYSSNPDYTIDYTSLNTVGNIISNSTYSDSSFSISDNDSDLDLNDFGNKF